MAQQEREPEFEGPIWKHPYVIYIGLTLVLALFLGLVGFLAYQNDWIPKR